jgi:hypothetical protein
MFVKTSLFLFICFNSERYSVFTTHSTAHTTKCCSDTLLSHQPSKLKNRGTPHRVIQIFERCCHTRVWSGLDDPYKVNVHPGGQREIDAYIADGALSTTAPPGGNPQMFPHLALDAPPGGVGTFANAAAAEPGAVSGSILHVFA